MSVTLALGLGRQVDLQLVSQSVSSNVSEHSCVKKEDWKWSRKTPSLFLASTFAHKHTCAYKSTYTHIHNTVYTPYACVPEKWKIQPLTSENMNVNSYLFLNAIWSRSADTCCASNCELGQEINCMIRRDPFQPTTSGYFWPALCNCGYTNFFPNPDAAHLQSSMHGIFIENDLVGTTVWT